MHRIDDHVRELVLDLIYDRRRDGYDPLTELLDAFEDVDSQAVERDAEVCLNLVDALDDHEDVQNVFSDFDISEEELAKLAGGSIPPTSAR